MLIMYNFNLILTNVGIKFYFGENYGTKSFFVVEIDLFDDYSLLAYFNHMKANHSNDNYYS